MALQLNITSSTGLDIKNAYYKVVGYSCDKENNISARLYAFVSKELSEKGASPIEGSEFYIKLKASYEDDSENTKKQIYEKVKKMEGFENSIDV